MYEEKSEKNYKKQRKPFLDMNIKNFKTIHSEQKYNIHIVSIYIIIIKYKNVSMPKINKLKIKKS